MASPDTVPALLILNAGSSSLKFAVHECLTSDASATRMICRGQFARLDTAQPQLSLNNRQGRKILQQELESRPRGEEAPELFEHLVDRLLRILGRQAPDLRWLGAGHRVVHGGSEQSGPAQIDDALIDRLQALTPLAPLHQPPGLAAIRALRRRWPELPQVACFDTAFHRSMPQVEQRYALPRECYDAGVRRYGFHGLSYEYIAAQLPLHLGESVRKRVVVAHLGHGASLCAMQEGRSMATTMGFTPLDGLPMATRSGALDPGIATWLIQQQGMSAAEVDELFNHRSGLLGLSGNSGDMLELLHDDRPEARLAVDYFVHHAHRALASMAAALGGLDALVFTGGIGEHSAVIRARICEAAAWLGIRLDARANEDRQPCISRPGSPVSVYSIATDEEQVIAVHAARLLHPSRRTPS